MKFKIGVVAVAAAMGLSAWADEATVRWVYRAGTLSNTVTQTRLTCNASGTNLTLTGVSAYGTGLVDGAKTLDLTAPVESADGATKYAIVAVSGSTIRAPFMVGAENLYLPDTLTTLGGQMIDCWGEKSSLRRVRLPATLRKIQTTGGSSGYSFRSCTNLIEVLPQGILEGGQITNFVNGNSMFRNCPRLTNNVSFANAPDVPSDILHGCTSITGDPHLENVASIGSEAFCDCTKMSFPATLAMPKVKSIGSSAFAETSISNLNLTGAPITTLNMRCARKLRSVTPLLPTTVSSFSFEGCYMLTGDVVVAAACASCGSKAFLESKVSSVDLSATSVKVLGEYALNGCTALTNVVLPKTYNCFSAVYYVMGNSTDLRWVRFMGDPPTVETTLDPFVNDKRLTLCVPLWSAAWTTYLASGTQCTVSEMTSSDVSNFRTYHPSVPVPVQKLALDALTTAYPLSRWAVDPPTEKTAGPLSLFETLQADGATATVSDALAFDGTTYALGAGDLMCLCAAGDEITVALPASATLTRGLKLTGYRLHQMSAGDHPNARAPTAWTLYGKKTDAADWTVIDTVAMTASSAGKWAYFGTDAATLPARDAASLTFTVPDATADCYVAFKFVPTASYQTESGADDATPIGFGELELLGAFVGIDPVMDDFAFVAPGWRKATFSATLKAAGEKISEHARAAWAKGTVELSETADFAEIAARSPATVLIVGEPIEIAVENLSVGATYYARLAVTNDLGGSSVEPLAAAFTTLAAPFEVTGGVFPAPVKTAGGFVVTVPLGQLSVARAALSLYYSASNVFSGEPIQTREVTAAGEVAFDAFASDDPYAFVKVRVEAVDGGVTYASEYVRSVHEIWLGNAVSATVISNTVNGLTFKCSTSGTNVTITGIGGYNGNTVFNLNLPVCDSACRPLAITGVGKVFAENKQMTALLLPDTITSISNQAFDQWGLSDAAIHLTHLRLPNGLKSATFYNFRKMSKLTVVENLMPEALTTLGENAFCYWSSVTNDVHFHKAFKTFSNKTPFTSGFTKVKRVYFHGAPPDPGSGVFAPMTRLEFFVPRGDAAWETYLAEKCATRAVTADDLQAFATYFPGERKPKKMVKIPSGAATWRYLRYWYPSGRGPQLLITIR